MDTFVAVETIEGHNTVEEKCYCEVQYWKDEDWQVVLCGIAERNAYLSNIFGRIRVLALLGPMCVGFIIDWIVRELVLNCTV